MQPVRAIRAIVQGADDLKTRAALIAFQGLDEKTKAAVIETEKKTRK